METNCGSPHCCFHSWTPPHPNARLPSIILQPDPRKAKLLKRLLQRATEDPSPSDDPVQILLDTSQELGFWLRGLDRKGQRAVVGEIRKNLAKEASFRCSCGKFHIPFVARLNCCQPQRSTPRVRSELCVDRPFSGFRTIQKQPCLQSSMSRRHLHKAHLRFPVSWIRV